MHLSSLGMVIVRWAVRYLAIAMRTSVRRTGVIFARLPSAETTFSRPRKLSEEICETNLQRGCKVGEVA